MKYATKAELTADAEKEYEALVARLEAVPRERWKEPGVWGDDWTVHDLVAHLSAWHRLLLGWHAAGERGEEPETPAPGYQWNELGRLNREIRAEHAHRPTAEVRDELEATHAAVLELARSVPEATLMERGRLGWTGSTSLAAYIGANTGSHYRFAKKVLKRWARAG